MPNPDPGPFNLEMLASVALAVQRQPLSSTTAAPHDVSSLPASSTTTAPHGVSSLPASSMTAAPHDVSSLPAVQRQPLTEDLDISVCCFNLCTECLLGFYRCGTVSYFLIFLRNIQAGINTCA